MKDIELFKHDLHQLIQRGTKIMIRLPADSNREMNDILSALQDQLVKTEKLSESQSGL